MPRYRLSPYDPASALLDSIAAVLRDGPADCADINPSPPAWTAGTTCPAGHYLFPEGSWLYTDRDPDSIHCEPLAVILTAPEDGKEKADEVGGFYSITVEILIRTRLDFPSDSLDSVLNAIAWILTMPIILDDTTRQQPQTRLSTSTLIVAGSDWTQNFTGLGMGKMESDNGHPQRIFSFAVTCGLAVAL